jgi:hypothetical protein
MAVFACHICDDGIENVTFLIMTVVLRMIENWKESKYKSGCLVLSRRVIDLWFIFFLYVMPYSLVDRY